VTPRHGGKGSAGGGWFLRGIAHSDSHKNVHTITRHDGNNHDDDAQPEKRPDLDAMVKPGESNPAKRIGLTSSRLWSKLRLKHF